MKKLSEMGFREQTALSRPAFRARDSSPDSVIYALESSFSLFSSASASVERCSFASEAHDRDSLISEISLVNLVSLYLVLAWIQMGLFIFEFFLVGFRFSG